MLRINSKKARENIRNYILKNVDFSGCTLEKMPGTDAEKLAALHSIACEEKRSQGLNAYDLIKDWICGVPGSIFDISGFIYYDDAKKVLAELLEETPEEANRYGGEKSFNVLVYLISREIIKAAE